MAFPTIEAPYGLIPVNRLDGLPYAGAMRTFPIASGYSSNIFKGDLVKLIGDGTIEKDTGTTAATPVGVFMGCVYSSPGLNYYLHSQYFPADTAADDIAAYVVDDPNALFKVAAVSATTSINGYGQLIVGANVALVQNAGDTATGNSKVAILGSSAATTATLPVRIIQGVAETVDSSGNFTEFLVKWNAGHQYLNTTGV